ncbi:MAG: hypothetical protein ACI3ZD_03425, partial [Prevotella sp.]
ASLASSALDLHLLCIVIMDKCEGGLRSGCWHLRSWLAWKAERCYLCSVDVGRADPEKPNSKESKERKEKN